MHRPCRTDLTGNGAACEFRRHQHLVRENELQSAIYCLEDGWACRYRQIGSARRQITALYLPGEVCEPQWLLQPRAVEPVVALTRLRASRVALKVEATPATLRSENDKMMAAVVRMLNRQSDWIATLGRKTAVERVGTLLCDVLQRLRATGRVTGSSFPLPLTQSEIADIVGLTPVHVNRVFKWLKGEGLVEMGPRLVKLPDTEALQALAAGTSATGRGAVR